MQNTHSILNGITNWPKLQVVSQIVAELLILKELEKKVKTCKDSDFIYLLFVGIAKYIFFLFLSTKILIDELLTSNSGINL